jgi:2'-5' RNA ligase
LFFALWPQPSMQEALLTAAGAALESAAGARVMPCASLHLTLAFLGSVPAARLAALDAPAREAIEVSRPLATPLVLSLDRLEHWRKAQLLCATAAQAPEAARQLSECLKERLVAAGFAPDLKPFRPHVTLARRVTHAGAVRTLAPVTWSFAEVTLIESRTQPGGSLYSTRATWLLCAS